MLKRIISTIAFPIDFLLDFDLYNKVQTKVLNTIGLVIIGFLITIGIFVYHIYF